MAVSQWYSEFHVAAQAAKITARDTGRSVSVTRIGDGWLVKPSRGEAEREEADYMQLRRDAGERDRLAVQLGGRDSEADPRCVTSKISESRYKH